MFFIYVHCEIHHKSTYNLKFGPGKVLEKSLVLIHQNLWEPWIYLFILPGWCQDEPEITQIILPEVKASGETGRLNCTVTRQGNNNVCYQDNSLTLRGFNDPIWGHVISLSALALEEGNGLLPNGSKPLPKPVSTYKSSTISPSQWHLTEAEWCIYVWLN